MEQVKALVHCAGINTSETSYKNKVGIGGLVKFSFNYHNQDEKHPNFEYFEATPSGGLEMYINNPDAMARLTVGKDYELILREIDPTEKQ